MQKKRANRFNIEGHVCKSQPRKLQTMRRQWRLTDSPDMFTASLSSWSSCSQWPHLAFLLKLFPLFSSHACLPLRSLTILPSMKMLTTTCHLTSLSSSPLPILPSALLTSSLASSLGQTHRQGHNAQQRYYLFQKSFHYFQEGSLGTPTIGCTLLNPWILY